jgi:hypothetical protein
MDKTTTIDYKYNELELLNQLKLYVDSTYSQHYAQGKIQTTEFIIDSGHGIGHTVGNIMKYAQRYGKKGGHNRKDILKILHYALIMLHVHDLENNETILKLNNVNDEDI